MNKLNTRVDTAKEKIYELENRQEYGTEEIKMIDV